MTIKLSEIQHAALVEVSELGYTVAKANTIKSLENKELIDAVGATHHKLTSKGRAVLGLPAVEETQTFHQKLMEDVAELESALQGDPWKIGDQITADEPYLEFNHDEGPLADGVERYQDHWAAWEKELAGFGETMEWRNTKVWDGLTAEEIREDMDTRVPANRADKRAHDRAQRKAIKHLVNAL